MRRAMMSMFVAAGLAALGAGTAMASAPAGVWALPDGVTVHTEAGAPATVEITGLFAVWTGQGDYGAVWGFPGFEDPAWGKLAYRCPDDADSAELCELEWRDIAAAARTGDCVGWGAAGGAGQAAVDNGTVRPFDDDGPVRCVYPIAQGVVTGFTPCQYLSDWKAEHPRPEPPADPTPTDPTPTDPTPTDPTPTDPTPTDPTPTTNEPVQTVPGDGNASDRPGASVGCAGGDTDAAWPLLLAGCGLAWLVRRRQRVARA